MSSVSIPNAAGPGKLAVSLTLTKEDLRIAVEKLRYAVQELRKRAPPGTAAAPSAPAAPQPMVPPAVVTGGPAAAPQAPAAQPVPVQSAMQPASLLSFLPMPGQTAAPAARPATPSQPQLQLPTAAPRPLPPPPRAPRPVPAPAAPPAYAAAALAYAAPARPQSEPAAPSGAMSWQVCWSTEAGDHNGDPVSALAYLPSLPGLPGGDGHAGWLVSSSRALLNLWECSPSGGRGEPALIMMHSQATDLAYAALDADRSTQLLLGACIDRGGAEWLAQHSLDVESGMLAVRGKCPMPQPGGAKIPGQNTLQVVSLHSFGAALEGCAAASYYGGIVVWQVGMLSKLNRPQHPRAMWKAHSSKITALHKSNFKLCLFSGADDGSLRMWSMREKPSAPALSWQHSGRVAGVAQVNEHMLVSGAADGRVMVWDLRRPADPLKFAVPDGKPIYRLAVSPFADCAAVATAGGLYSVDLLEHACHANPIMPAPPRTPITALAWNATTSEVLVGGGAGGNGSISVYRQRHVH